MECSEASQTVVVPPIRPRWAKPWKGSRRLRLDQTGTHPSKKGNLVPFAVFYCHEEGLLQVAFFNLDCHNIPRGELLIGREYDGEYLGDILRLNGVPQTERVV